MLVLLLLLLQVFFATNIAFLLLLFLFLLLLLLWVLFCHCGFWCSNCHGPSGVVVLVLFCFDIANFLNDCAVVVAVVVAGKLFQQLRLHLLLLLPKYSRNFFTTKFD